jgi:hypothetical protein
MNAYLIWGIVVVALGTLLMTYGGIVQSRKDAAKSSDKLDSISRDVADLKGKPKSDLSANAIKRVETDIAKWAKEFASEKQQRKLRVEEQLSAHQSAVDHSNELIRGYFQFFLTVLREALISYAKDAKSQVDLTLPEASPLLFSNPDSRYEGRVVFSPLVSWNIATHYNTQVPNLAGPSFIVTLIKSNDDGTNAKENGELMVRFSSDVKSFYIRLQRDFLLAVPTHSERKTTLEYEDTMKSILKSLIEFQLSQN